MDSTPELIEFVFFIITSTVSMPSKICLLFFFIRLSISFTLEAVWSASLEISKATTANPFPAVPALAASIDALSARRLIFSEIVFIISYLMSVDR